jgi:hypothetical protein
MLWVQNLLEIFNMHKWLWEAIVKQNTKDDGENKATMYGKRYPWIIMLIQNLRKLKT